MTSDSQIIQFLQKNSQDTTMILFNNKEVLYVGSKAQNNWTNKIEMGS